MEKLTLTTMTDALNYMKNDNIEINVNVFDGSKFLVHIQWISQKNILKLILITEVNLLNY